MRSIIAGVGLVCVLLLGCNNLPQNRGQIGRDVGQVPRETPTPEKLVKYLNDNADRVEAIQCNNLTIDCDDHGHSVSLGGLMACQKPKNFRLKAKLLGQPGVDIGSNNEEFWYWISKADPPYVFHCSYDKLNQGNIALPFPFQPEVVISALGIAHYDPTKKYELKENRNNLELIEPATSMQGHPIQHVTVFNRMAANINEGQPQVTGHILRDSKGTILCQANISRVQVNRETGAVLPLDVTLNWPSQHVKMRLSMNDVHVVKINPEGAERLFQRRDLADRQHYDLYRRMPDGPGLQQTGAIIPRN
jgi:hypothetical protein